MKKREIPFARPWITQEDKNAVLSVLDGHILTHGPKCKDFEYSFSKFLGAGANSVSVSSCMAALHLAYLQMGIGKGDEVIVPALTHTATAHAVEMVGAKPIFVDCDLRTGNIDVKKISNALTPSTKAISLVHFLGIPCEMDEIVTMAEKNNLKVVEDCALAVGSKFKQKHVGLWGDVGCFSFYPVKHITTGEGGMFVSRHQNIAQDVARIRAFGVDRGHAERKMGGVYDVLCLGLNYRMSEMQAALGLEQINKIPEILKRRKGNFDLLRSILSDINGMTILDSQHSDQINSHYCLTALLPEKMGDQRDKIIQQLAEQGVGTSVYYPHPIPHLSFYKKKYGLSENLFPNASRVSYHSIAFPVGPHLNQSEMQYIGEVFRKIYSGR